MIGSDELRALIEEWRKPAPKGRPFGKKSKSAAGRLAAAHRLAELARDASGEGLVEALGRASGAFSDDRSVRRAYARALADAGRIGEAIAEFEERLQTNPDDAEDLVDVGDLYKRAGRSDLAADRLRRAVDAHVAANDLDSAVTAARMLIVLEPQSLESAADLVSILRARDPALLAEGLEHLADVYRERGKLGQEAAACGELLALQPEREDARKRLAAIYTSILEVDPDDNDAWVGLATVDEPLADQLRVLLARDEPPERLLSTSLVTPIEQHQTYAGRKAEELMHAGDMVGASLCLERMVRTDPAPENHLRLAECYLAMHRDQDAARQGLRSLAVAQTFNEFCAADEALAWLTALLPRAGEPLADAVILNHRPGSADILYEELLQLWDAVAGTPGGARAIESPE